jgi:hypothetical protein
MESRPWNRSLSTARADDKEFVPGSYKQRAMAAQKLSLQNPNHFGTPRGHTHQRPLLHLSFDVRSFDVRR